MSNLDIRIAVISNSTTVYDIPFKVALKDINKYLSSNSSK